MTDQSIPINLIKSTPPFENTWILSLTAQLKVIFENDLHNLETANVYK